MSTRGKKIKVEDKPNLVRDSFSKAIINTDRATYTQHRLRKKNLIERNRRLISLEASIESLQNEHAAMLKMIEGLTNKYK